MAMKLADVVLDCKETKILNLKHFIQREQLNLPEQLNPWNSSSRNFCPVHGCFFDNTILP